MVSKIAITMIDDCAILILFYGSTVDETRPIPMLFWVGILIYCELCLMLCMNCWSSRVKETE